MKKDFYPDTTVCSLHLKLKKDYKILNKVLHGFKTVNNVDVNELLNEMYCISKSIHYKAQRMEKRLMKYYLAVESLGFTRVKKKGKNNGCKN